MPVEEMVVIPQDETIQKMLQQVGTHGRQAVMEMASKRRVPGE
jgi:urease accessory protein UreE